MKLILTLTTLLFSSALLAQDGPCAKDRETFCKGIEPGGGRIMKCMKENADKLSPECKAQHEKMKDQMKDVKEACHDDAQTLCPGKERHELKHCMRENKDKVSEACKKEWKELKMMGKEHEGHKGH